MVTKPTALQISVKEIGGTLGKAIGLLAFLNLVTLVLEFGVGIDHAKGFVPRFRLSEETSVPTVFSVGLLLLLSTSLALVAAGSRVAGDPRTKQWSVLSIIAAALAFDEGATIHELFDDHTGWIDWLYEPSGFLAWPWVIAYGGIVIGFTIAFAPFFFSLSRRFQIIFGSAALLYVGAAIGLEMLEAVAFETLRAPLLFEILASIEETMEMAGVSIAICGLVAYAQEYFGWQRVMFLHGETITTQERLE
ncbi:MAG: hypothetical protein AAF668_02015 [Pseudomonadota bacterium]